MQFRIKRTHCELIDNLEGIHEKDLSFETLADIIYIAGYVIRHDLLTEDTSDYCEKYGSFLKEIIVVVCEFLAIQHYLVLCIATLSSVK